MQLRTVYRKLGTIFSNRIFLTVLLDIHQRDVASAGIGFHRHDVLLVIGSGLEFQGGFVAGGVRKILAVAAFAAAGELVAVLLMTSMQGDIASFALQKLSIFLLQVFAIPIEHFFRRVIAVVVERDYLELPPGTGDVHVCLIVIVAALWNQLCSGIHVEASVLRLHLISTNAHRTKWSVDINIVAILIFFHFHARGQRERGDQYDSGAVERSAPASLS